MGFSNFWNFHSIRNLFVKGHVLTLRCSLSIDNPNNYCVYFAELLHPHYYLSALYFLCYSYLKIYSDTSLITEWKKIAIIVSNSMLNFTKLKRPFYLLFSIMYHLKRSDKIDMNTFLKTKNFNNVYFAKKITLTILYRVDM